MNHTRDRTERETISEFAERVTFHSPETCFCVLPIKTRVHRELITFVATAVSIQTGEYIHTGGRWDNHCEPDRRRAFRIPFVPLVPILGILSCVYLMRALPEITWLRFG